jgi:uncharacterized protein YndB with AHSA1/START domain
MLDIVFSNAVTLEFSREYPVTSEALWHALTDSKDVSAWMGYDCTFDPRPGGLFTIGVRSQFIHAVVCYVNPGKSIVTMFRETLIFQTVEDRGSSSVHSMRQIGIVPESAASFASGWHHLLDRLAAHLTGSLPDLTPEKIEARYEEQFRAYAQTHGMMRPS